MNNQLKLEIIKKTREIMNANVQVIQNISSPNIENIEKMFNFLKINNADTQILNKLTQVKQFLREVPVVPAAATGAVVPAAAAVVPADAASKATAASKDTPASKSPADAASKDTAATASKAAAAKKK